MSSAARSSWPAERSNDFGGLSQDGRCPIRMRSARAHAGHHPDHPEHLPDTLLANGQRIARPGESMVVKFLNDPLNAAGPSARRQRQRLDRRQLGRPGRRRLHRRRGRRRRSRRPHRCSARAWTARSASSASGPTRRPASSACRSSSPRCCDNTVGRTVRGVDQSQTYPKPMLGTRRSSARAPRPGRRRRPDLLRRQLADRLQPLRPPRRQHHRQRRHPLHDAGRGPGRRRRRRLQHQPRHGHGLNRRSITAIPAPATTRGARRSAPGSSHDLSAATSAADRPEPVQLRQGDDDLELELRQHEQCRHPGPPRPEHAGPQRGVTIWTGTTAIRPGDVFRDGLRRRAGGPARLRQHVLQHARSA